MDLNLNGERGDQKSENEGGRERREVIRMTKGGEQGREEVIGMKEDRRRKRSDQKKGEEQGKGEG